MSVKYLPVVEEWEINDWNSGLLDCFSDAPICLCGCFFSPCLFGCNNKVLGGGNLMCCLDCLSVLFGGRNGWGTFYTAMRRKEFRRKYGLMQSSEKTKCFCGVQTNDYTVNCCCGPCSACQEAREVKFWKHRDPNPTIPTIPTAPKQDAMQ